MRLFALQPHHLQDRLFVRQWSARMAQVKEPSLILYNSLNTTIEDIKFTGKRITALLNEAMVPAIACMGDQRALVTARGDDEFVFHPERLQSLWAQAYSIVYGALLAHHSTIRLVPLPDCLKAIAESKLFSRKYFFAKNELSPLANPARLVASHREIEELIELFPEEKTVLELAAGCLPCDISTAHNFDVD